MIFYGCCVGTWEKFQYNSRTWPGPVAARLNQSSISVAYNSFLDQFVDREPDAVVLVHDDLEITDPDFEAKILAAVAEPNVALAGVAGGGAAMAWWNLAPVGHQMTDSGLIDFGIRTGDVDIIEGSVMAFSPWAIRHLRFDERYEFLGYDDVCLHARAAGKRVIVRDIDTHHHSTAGGFKSESVREMWERSEAIFNNKWSGRCAS